MESVIAGTTLLRDRVAAAFVTGADGEISLHDVLTNGDNLAALGMTSLTQLRIVDTIESTFGIALDLEREDLSYLDKLDEITDFLIANGVS